MIDWSKFKAFAGDKINLTEKLKLVLRRLENIAGKGQNADYQHFLLSQQCFQKPSHSGSLKELIHDDNGTCCNACTAEPVLETTCIKRPPALTLSQTSLGFYVSAVQVF